MPSRLLKKPSPEPNSRAEPDFVRENKREAAPDRASSIQNRRPLHVALDLRLMQTEGIGTYLRGLLSGFAEIAPPVEWTFIGLRLALPPSLNVREWIRHDAPPRLLTEHRDYPELKGVDIFHYPQFNLPRTSAAASVATVHDLHPLLSGSWRDRQQQRLGLNRLAWGRTAVIAPSEALAEKICRVGRISSSRVAAIEPGPGEPLVGLHAVDPLGHLQLPDGSRLRGPWLLVMGGLEASDNMEFLVSAMALWFRRRPEAPPLVWALPTDDDRALRQVAEAAALIPASARSRIFIATCTDRHQLHRLYSGARALMYPPFEARHLYHPLEAMARGLPVVCSRRPAMVDRLGGAPLWFDPEDSSSLWRVLDALLDVEGLLKEASARSRRRAAERDWADAARETLEVYKRQFAAVQAGRARRRWFGGKAADKDSRRRQVLPQPAAVD